MATLQVLFDYLHAKFLEILDLQKEKEPFLMTVFVSQEILLQVVNEITGALYDYVMDRNASHVVRRLLCVIAGRNLLDGKSKNRINADSGSKVRDPAMFYLRSRGLYDLVS